MFCLTAVNDVVIADLDCSDDDGDTLTYSITSQVPQADFSIDDTGAAVKLIVAGNYIYMSLIILLRFTPVH